MKTNILGIADKKITVVTDYKGNIRKHLIGYTLIPGPYHNPLSDFISKKENLLTKKAENIWLIKYS